MDIHLNASVEKIIGEDEVEGIVIGEQTIPCDSVIYSVGVVPNLDVVEHTSIYTNRGIIVNEKMETNIKNVYAAGDVTELNGEVLRSMESSNGSRKNCWRKYGRC